MRCDAHEAVCEALQDVALVEAWLAADYVSEVMRLLSDNTLARDLLGWTPQISMEEGLARTIAWARTFRQLGSWQGYAR